MKNRNTKVAEESGRLLAYTYGEGDVPMDGGTKDTWDKHKGIKKHISISKIFQPTTKPVSGWESIAGVQEEWSEEETAIPTPVSTKEETQKFTIKKDDSSNWSLILKNGKIYNENTNKELDSEKDIRLINKVKVKEAYKAGRYASFEYNNSKYAAIITYDSEFKIVSMTESNMGGEVFKQGSSQFNDIIDKHDNISELYRKYCKG